MSAGKRPNNQAAHRVAERARKQLRHRALASMLALATVPVSAQTLGEFEAGTEQPTTLGESVTLDAGTNEFGEGQSIDPKYQVSRQPFDDYQFSGWAFNVLEDTALNRIAGCTQLNLMISPGEMTRYLKDPQAELLSLLKTNGENIFECAGEQIAAGPQFLVHSDQDMLYVVMATEATTLTTVAWKAASAPLMTRLSGLDRIGLKGVNEPRQLAQEVGHLLLNAFVSHEVDLQKALSAGPPSQYNKAIQGTVLRDSVYAVGGWYDGIFYRRPVQYDSGWLNHTHINTGSECSDSPASTKPYDYLAITQWPTGNETKEDCGHMLGKQLGGSGRYNGPSGTTSVFSQNRTINRGTFANYEGKVKNLMVCNSNCNNQSGRAYVRLEFNYNGNGSRNTRADSVRYRVWCPSNDAVCKQRMTNNFGTHPAAYSTYMDFQNPYQPNIWKEENEYHDQDNTAHSTYYSGYSGSGYRYFQSGQDSQITFLYDSPQATTLTFFVRTTSGTDQYVDFYNGVNGTNHLGNYRVQATATAGTWEWRSLSIPLSVGTNRIKMRQASGNHFRVDQVVLQ